MRRNDVFPLLPCFALPTKDWVISQLKCVYLDLIIKVIIVKDG